MNKLFHILVGCLLVAILCTVVACTDDDSFTSSSSNRLTFSTDTIKMDTVFSQVPTPTKTFWVYNRSGDGLRCRNVRLRNGNQSGFRVNVDGVYLGSESGFQTSDIEVRDKDSIRVFVELTSPQNGSDEPEFLEDELVFTLESGVEQEVVLNGYSWDAEFVRNLVITRDTTFTGTKPRVVYGTIDVKEGATLTLSAGTTLYFHSHAGIDVHGRLQSLGTADNNVTLRGDRLDRMFDYLPYDLVSGRWGGLQFYEESYDNTITYTDIHSASTAISCDSSDVSQRKLILTSSTIHNSQGYGLAVLNSNVYVENCQITNSLLDCVYMYGGVGEFNHCTIGQFYPFDSNRGYALYFYATDEDPLLLKCTNSLVTGYGDDVVIGSTTSDEAVFDYYFANCILRTPKVDDEERFVNIIWEDPKDTAAIAGYKHFRVADINKQYYDFHLKDTSPAIGEASPEYPVELDRDGNKRETPADIGCYEYILPKEKEQ